MSVGELIVSITGDMSKLSETFSKVQADAGNLGSKIKDIGSGASSMGAGMTAGITVPLVAVGAGIGATVLKAAEFDTGMRRVATMLPGITEAGLGKISGQALDLSKQFGSSTGDMTNAMYQALSSGIPQDNIFGFMQDAEKLAIGGATDVVTSTDVLTNAVNAYGKENLSTAQASDILFQGTKFGKSTVEELAHSLSNVVPVAASVGVSFADVNASLAAMTIQGTPTAEATTQLRAIIDELSTPTSNVASAFDYLSGQSFPDYIKAGGTVGGAMDILQKSVGTLIPDQKKLAESTKALSNPTSQLSKDFETIAHKSFADFAKGGGTVEQALDMMGVKYGNTSVSVKDYFARIEAGTGALQLTGEGQKLYTQALDGTTKAAGSTEAAYKTMSTGAGASLDRLKSSFEVLAIKVGDDFLPILTDTLLPAFDGLSIALDKVEPYIKMIADAFNSLPAPVKLGALAFLAFIVALGPILMVVGSVATGIGSLAALFGAGGVLAVAFAAAQAAIAVVVAALATIGLPILILVGLVALVGIAWARDWGGIREKTAAVWDWLTTAVSNLWNRLEYYYHAMIMGVATLKTGIGTAWDNIKTAISTAATSIITTIQGWYTSLQAKYNQVVALGAWLYTQVQGAYNTLKAAFLAGINAIVSTVQTLYSGLQAKYNTISTLGTWLYAQVQATYNNLKAAFLSGINTIISTVQTLYSGLQAKYNTISTLGTWLYAQVQATYNNLKAAFLSGINTIISTVQTLYSGLQAKYNTISTLGTWLYAQVQATYNNLKAAFLSGINTIVSTVQTLYSGLQAKYNTIATLGTWLYAQVQASYNNLKAAFLSGINTIISTVQTLYSGLQAKYNTITALGTSLLSSWKTHWSNITSATSTAASTVSSALSGLLSKAQSAFNSIISAALGLLNSWKTHWNNLVSATNSAASTVASALSGLLSKAQSAFNSIISAALSLLNSWKTHWNNLVSATNSAASTVASALNGLLTKAKTAFNSIIAAALSLLNSWKSNWNNLVSATNSAASSIASALSGLLSKAQSAFNSIIAAANALLTKWKTVWSSLSTAVSSIAGTVVSAISGLASKISGLASSFYNAGAAIIDNLRKGVEAKIQAVKNSITGLLSWISSNMPHSPALMGPLTKLPNFAAYITDPLAKAVSTAKTTAKGVGSSIINTIAKGVTSAAKTVYNAASSALSKVSSLLPHSPAEEGPFSVLPDWDSVFVKPMLNSIDSVSKLSTPMSNALTNVRNPINSSMSAGFNKISNVANNSSAQANVNNTITIGPNTLSNDIDLQKVFIQFQKWTKLQGLQRGYVS